MFHSILCFYLLFISKIQIPNAPTETHYSPSQLSLRAVTGPKHSHFDRVPDWVNADEVFLRERGGGTPPDEEEELCFQAFLVLPELLFCSFLEIIQSPVKALNNSKKVVFLVV